MTDSTATALGPVPHPHSVHAPPGQDEHRCRDAVDRLLARHTWQLLEREEFARRTHEQLRAGVATDPARAAMHTYSQALYSACSGAEGTQRQNLAYTELFRYLYDSAWRRYPDVCDDATQGALERTFTTFERCRQPGAFVAFALQHLRDVARALRRQDAQRPQSLATPIGEGDDTLGDVLPDVGETNPAVQVLAQDLRRRLRHLAAEFVRQHPRAGQQLSALWLKYVAGLDEAAISEALGKPVQSLYVLRARAIKKLQAEPRWRALAVDCGILP